MMSFSLSHEGLEFDVNVSEDDASLGTVTVADMEMLARWLVDGATDADLNVLASAIVHEQIGRDEAAQTRQDIAEAIDVVRKSRAALVVDLAKADPSKFAEINERIAAYDAELAMMGAE